MRTSLSVISIAAMVAAAPTALSQGFNADELLSETETWFQAPAISPDGSTIAFAAHGDIWTVSSAGGVATPLTRDNGWDGMPVWSRDGTQLAFASDRNGNLDVFVMNANGTGLTRLTHHDANDYPSDFAPDGSGVLFASARGQSASSSYFPTGALPQLYQVSTEGGTPRMVTTVPGMEARYSPDGTKIAYRDE